MRASGHTRLTSDGEAEAFARILSICFGASFEDAQVWIEDAERESVRLLKNGERVAGGLFHVPMGQWWGRREVSMVGIGGVGIEPSERASGGATDLMHATVRELHAEGIALSTLYPATQPLYRRAGYEQAGGHFSVTVSPQRLFARDRALGLRRIEEDDRAEVERLHREHGRENPGNVVRGDTWKFLHEARERPVHGFCVEGDKGLEGYVFYRSHRNDVHHQNLDVRDLVARTPAAARRLLAFFRDHRTLVDEVRWRGSPADPLLLQAREQRHGVRLKDVWMLRVVHVERALTQRGYPEGVDVAVDLEVTDDLLPANAGRWRLSVAAGRGHVERGGDGRVQLDVRTLAPLYSGYASPWQLRTARGLACDDDDAARLATTFAGPIPWMQDGF